MARVSSAGDRLAFLDVARGVAALLVLTHHAAGPFLFGLRPALPGWLCWALVHIDAGRAGVVLFLLVSGFIIPVSLEQGGSNARFWLRRFFRLFPAYWLSIALALVYCAGGGRRICDGAGEGVGDWLLNLTMLQHFFRRPDVWGVFWTLQLELVIYAACSLLFVLRLLHRTVWVAVLMLAGYAALGLAEPLLEGKPFVIGPHVLYFAPLAGLLAQRCVAGRIGRRTLAALLQGLALLVPALWLLSHARFPEALTTDCLVDWACAWGAAYAGFFLLLAARDRPMPAAACRLGRISYSVYLLHPLVLGLVEWAGWPTWTFLPCVLGGTLLLAEPAYRLVEAPGVALGRALEKRLLPAVVRPGPATAAPRRAA